MNKVLFITNKTDTAVNSIVVWLERVNHPYIRINFEDYLSAQKDLVLAINNNSNDPEFIVDGFKIHPLKITSICYRRPHLLSKTDSDVSEFIEAQWKQILYSLATTFTGYWVNHPFWGNHLIEHNKLYQLKCAASIGLTIPDTIVSNCSEEILKFCIGHSNKVACKPLRHTNIINEHNRHVGIYTQMVTTEEFIAREIAISICPMIVQEYVEKFVELRVTIIGSHLFVCEIHSQDSDRTKHDWRKYDFDKVKHAVHVLPLEIRSRILQLMHILKLNFGAMDLILTPNGEYVFLEVNPSGQYGWIEELTSLPISETFAQSLISPSKNGINRFSF